MRIWLVIGIPCHLTSDLFLFKVGIRRGNRSNGGRLCSWSINQYRDSSSFYSSTLDDTVRLSASHAGFSGHFYMLPGSPSSVLVVLTDLESRWSFSDERCYSHTFSGSASYISGYSHGTMFSSRDGIWTSVGLLDFSSGFSVAGSSASIVLVGLHRGFDLFFRRGGKSSKGVYGGTFLKPLF